MNYLALSLWLLPSFGSPSHIFQVVPNSIDRISVDQIRIGMSEKDVVRVVGRVWDELGPVYVGGATACRELRWYGKKVALVVKSGGHIYGELTITKVRLLPR